MEVGRVAADLQLAPNGGTRRRGEVEHVEGIDLAEGDDVPGVLDEPHRVHPLALSEPADAAERHQRAGARRERRDDRLAVRARAAGPDREVGARHSQDAVPLGERPLAQQHAGNAAARAIDGLRRARDVEAVDRRRRPRGPRPGRDRRVVALGRDVEARPARVDHPSAGDDRVGVDRVEPTPQVERQHGHEAETGEQRRTADVPTLDDSTARDDPPRGTAQRVARQPASRPGRSDDLPVPLRRLRGVGNAGAARTDEGEIDPDRRRQDDTHRGAHHARRQVPAVQLERPRDAHPRRVGDVDLGEDGARGIRPRRADRDPTVDRDRRGRALREDEKLPAVE